MKPNKNIQVSTARNRLLKSALKIFSRKGYSASIREIAVDSGTTLPSLYYYFGNKEGLYKELIQEHYSKFESLRNDYDQPGSTRQRLKSFILITYQKMIEDAEFVRLTRTISYGPPKGAPPFDLKPYYRNFHDFLTTMIQMGIKRGEFRTGKADEMAWILRGALQMAAEELCFSFIGKLDQKKLESILDIILDGFKKK